MSIQIVAQSSPEPSFVQVTTVACKSKKVVGVNHRRINQSFKEARESKLRQKSKEREDSFESKKVIKHC